MPFPNDPTPSIVGRELLGPQTGRTVIQGLPDFDPVAFLERAKTKAGEPSADVVSDESSLPEDEDPAPLMDLSSEGPSPAQWRQAVRWRQSSRGEQIFDTIYLVSAFVLMGSRQIVRSTCKASSSGSELRMHSYMIHPGSPLPEGRQRPCIIA